MTNLRSKMKHGFLAVFAFALIMGAVNARAILIDPNDLILVLYGNTNEYYRFIDRTSALHPDGTTTYVIDAAGVQNAGNTSTTKWALISWNTDTGDLFGTASSLNVTLKGPATSADIATPWNNAAGWSFQTNNHPANNLASDNATIPAAAPESYTSWVDNLQDGRLNGSFPPGNTTAGAYGDTMAIVTGDFNTGAITSTGHTATLALNPAGLGAILTINHPAAPAPVPIPAAVVLFGTGLVGLVGVARRRLVAV